MRHIFNLLTIAAIAIGLASCDSGSGPDLNGGSRSKVLEVDYVVLDPRQLVHEIQVTGTLIPGESAELTTQASGKVHEILFEEGQKVRKGQTLMRLDDREWRAQLQRYEAELETAQKDLERKQQLAKVKGITESELEEAQLRKKTLEANIEETRVRLDYATITAPFDGKIGLRHVSPGSFVSSGSSVATLVQDNPVKLQFNVPERYASEIKTGQQLTFRIADQDQEYEAEIYAMEPMISESTRALLVRAKAENPRGDLIPGSYASVVVTLDSIPNALMLPTEAVIPQLNSQYVFRMKNGVAEQTKVKLGVRQPKKVQITEGLQAGDSILVSGLLQVKPGMAVKGDKEVDVESFENGQ